MAEYKGTKVKLNKPFRTPNQTKKFAVYVKNPRTGNTLKVRFGDPKMKIKKNIPARTKRILTRQNCKTAREKTTARDRRGKQGHGKVETCKKQKGVKEGRKKETVAKPRQTTQRKEKSKYN